MRGGWVDRLVTVAVSVVVLMAAAPSASALVHDPRPSSPNHSVAIGRHGCWMWPARHLVVCPPGHHHGHGKAVSR